MLQYGFSQTAIHVYRSIFALQGQRRSPKHQLAAFGTTVGIYAWRRHLPTELTAVRRARIIADAALPWQKVALIALLYSLMRVYCESNSCERCYFGYES